MVALQVLGYENVRNLAGGITAWTNGQFEVVTDPMPEAARGAAPDIDPALVAAVDAYLSGIPQGFGVVQPADVSTELAENPPFLLDVREVSEWDTDGYIEGAVNIPLRTLAASLDLLPADKDTPIVIYCKAGTRGSIGMTIVQMLGYTNVRNMAGGIMGWINAGFPVVGGTAAEGPAEPVAVTLPTGTVLPVESLTPVVADALVAIPQGFASIPAETLMQAPDSYFILDVRELDEYEAGHIAGAVNIPLRTLAQNLHLLPAKDAPIVIYCAIGHRGGIGTLALNLLGYTNAVSLRSGINGWTAAGGETVLESTPAVAAGAFPEVDADLWATVDAYLTNLPEGFGLVSAEDLNIALAEATPPVIVDVRETSEFAQGHIEGAVNIPLRELGASLDQLPATDAPIVVYDHIGHRGVFAMAALQMMGYENVRSLKNGSNAWVAAGLPFVTE
jgi:rhodanese-related sulfurtransferase